MIWWTKTWNPVIGCTKCSPACDNCYAEALHTQRHKAKLAGAPMPLCYAEPFDRVRFLPERLTQPLHWRKPQRIFVGNMGDLFHEDVPFETLDRIFSAMALSPDHTFMLCTKRPQRMREYLTSGRQVHFDTAMAAFRELELNCSAMKAFRTLGIPGHPKYEPLRNVWLGTTIWDQASADRAVPILLSTPAAKRFVSVEPMLGPVDIEDYLGWRGDICPDCCGSGQDDYSTCPTCNGTGQFGLGWVICGGETGPGARPMHPDWPRNLRDQCQAAEVPFFFKQWGEWAPWEFEVIDGARNVTGGRPHYKVDSFGRGEPKRLGSRKAGRLLDGREWNEVPS